MKTKRPKKPSWKGGESVTAFDATAQAMSMDGWQPAVVREVLWEDGAWWVRVIFENGGRSSILKPEGVRAR